MDSTLHSGVALELCTPFEFHICGIFLLNGVVLPWGILSYLHGVQLFMGSSSPWVPLSMGSSHSAILYGVLLYYNGVVNHPPEFRIPGSKPLFACTHDSPRAPGAVLGRCACFRSSQSGMKGQAGSRELGRKRSTVGRSQLSLAFCGPAIPSPLCALGFALMGRQMICWSEDDLCRRGICARYFHR